MNRDYKTPAGTAQPDWRGLCEELVEALDGWQLGGAPPEDDAEQELLDRARLALAQPEPEVVGPSDEELLELMPETMRDEFSYAAKTCSDAIGGQVKPGLFRVCLNTAALEYARAVLARWGRPAPALAEDVAEFVAQLKRYAETGTPLRLVPFLLTRAAALLQRQAAPQPVPVDGWQPIDTALKDGTEILASDYDAIEIVSWSKNLEWDTWYWTTRDGKVMFPAWWQPLADHPPLPTTTPAGQEGA